MTRDVLILVDAQPQSWMARTIDALHSAGVNVRVECEPQPHEGLWARLVRTCAGATLRTVRLAGPTRRAASSEADLCIDLRTIAWPHCNLRPRAAETWFFEIGRQREGVAAFDNVLAGDESIDVRLVARRGVELRELRYGRFPSASCLARTLSRIFAECVSWPQRELALPARWEDTRLLESRSHQSASIGWLDTLRFLWAEAMRLARYAARFVFEEARWDVAVTSMPIEAFIADPRGAWLHWIARNRNEFLADPFLAERSDGRTQLLCETLNGGTPGIVAIDLDDRFGERTPILDGNGPASYPYVFDVDGESWLIPERAARCRLDAYRLAGTETDLAGLMLDGIAAVDPTIVEYAGRWWLFCTDHHHGPNYALRIYWSEHPRGPWRAHADNPVKIDIAGARPGGTPFVRDGTLYRPAQDCTGRYGHAITIHRIDVLTPERFQESRVARIDAAMLNRKGAIGVHTLSFGHGWVAVDAQFIRWSLRKPLHLALSRARVRHAGRRAALAVPT